MRIAAIHRYPVKGLSPEPLDFADLAVGQTIVNDRRYAIENGPSGFDPAAPSYQPKIKFLMLMRNERLAGLRTRFDDDSTTLTIDSGGHEAARGDLSTKEGRLAIEAFFRVFMPKELRGPPKVLEAPGHSFSDVAAKVVSLINLKSVADIERVTGAAVDPLRFRGNLHIEGLDAWGEFALLGKTLKVPSGAELKVTKRIVRCAATEVDPATGMRDLDVPEALMRAFDHTDCGIYASVTAPGRIATGDALEVV
jgi:uncharacterized protein YcbX